MNIMSHKGYTARIEFDERDNFFVGRVLGLSCSVFHRKFMGRPWLQRRRQARASINGLRRYSTKPRMVEPSW